MSKPLIYCDKVQSLFQKYENDPYMSQRLHFHLMNILPATLENESKNHEKRILRNHFLTNEQQIFIQVFLSKNQYYYLHNNSCFYQYDGKNYSAIKEDDIQHQLLTSISKDRTLAQWKYKTKINIIKQIKDRHLFCDKFKPETDTIQHILKMLCSTIVSSKNQAKYLLTIIGDNILKKNTDLIFLTRPKTRKMIVELEQIAYMTTGMTNITHNLITKYHENYSYDNCRLLKINTISQTIWKNILLADGLNLLCVAAHYSHRYGGSDNFINNNNDETLNNYTLYLKNNNQNNIVENFCSNSLESFTPFPISNADFAGGNELKGNVAFGVSKAEKCNKFSINWKNMHYIWKLYISSSSLPNIIYVNTLKGLLINRFQYDETTDTFLNITSKYLPVVSDFINFWERNITPGDLGNELDNEFEIDELCDLFKKWASNKTNNCSSNGTINEHDVLKILQHYFPNIEIVENKYVLNVSCVLWDKLPDINASLNQMKEKKEDENPLISFDELYDNYFNYCTKNKSAIKPVVSKRYFEKYLYVILADYIEFDTFISNKWFQNNG